MVEDIAKIKNFIAKRVSKELKKGDLVNLGIGIPTLVANYIDNDFPLFLHSENGFIGHWHKDVKGDHLSVDASGEYIELEDGGVFFDSATSFSIIRSGRLDITVLGALQVSKSGDLANHMIPGKFIPGMGGAMDLATHTKRVIVAMRHTSNGDIKIVNECSLPLTSKGSVDTIITDLAVIKVSKSGLILKEISANTTVDNVQKLTEPMLIVDKNLKTMEA